MPQTVQLNATTGQLEVSIGNVRYEVIPGSAAELDILGGQYLVQSSQPPQPQERPPHRAGSDPLRYRSTDHETEFQYRPEGPCPHQKDSSSSSSQSRPTAVQQIIGARLGRMEQHTFVSKNVIKDNAGQTIDGDLAAETGISPKQDSHIFKKPFVPVRFQHDFNQIVSNIETVFSDDIEDEVERDPVDSIPNIKETNKEPVEKIGKLDEVCLLPHKKRICSILNNSNHNPVVKLVQEQEEVVDDEEEEEVRRSSMLFECNVCSLTHADQRLFYLHLKEHYEPKTLNPNADAEKANSVPDVVNNAMAMEEEGEYSRQIEPDKPDKPNIVTISNLNSKRADEARINDIRKDRKTTTTQKKQNKKRRNKLESKKFECELCNGKEFQNKHALTVHQRIHNDERPFSCVDCSKSFRQQSDLNYHRQSIHSDKKEHQCEFCGKEFSRKYSLTIHRKIHTGEKDHVCDICQKPFRAAVYLQCHKRIHTGERPYSCDSCGKPFRVRADMQRHKSHVHQKKPSSKRLKV